MASIYVGSTSSTLYFCVIEFALGFDINLVRSDALTETNFHLCKLALLLVVLLEKGPFEKAYCICRHELSITSTDKSIEEAGETIDLSAWECKYVDKARVRKGRIVVLGSRATRNADAISSKGHRDEFL
jgi:hypothetical protein